MAGKQARGDRTSERILEAAMAIFRENGSTRIPVTDLCERSGVTAGSLYHHFECMDGVAAALYVRCMSGLLERIAAAMDRQESPEAQISSLVKAYLAWTKKNPDEARFIHASAFQPFIRRYAGDIAGAKKASMEKIAAAVLAHARTGRFVGLPDFLYEMIIIGPVAETARRWLDGDRSVDLGKAAKTLPELILRALRT